MWFGRKKWFGKDNADEVYLWIYSGIRGEILVNNQKVGVKDKFAENPRIYYRDTGIYAKLYGIQKS